MIYYDCCKPHAPHKIAPSLRNHGLKLLLQMQSPAVEPLLLSRLAEHLQQLSVLVVITDHDTLR